MRKLYYFILLVLVSVYFYRYSFANKTETYVINLERSKDRWMNISKQFDKLNLKYQRFNAIDGYKVTLEDIELGNKFTGLDIKNRSTGMVKDRSYKIYCDASNVNSSFMYMNQRDFGLSSGEIGVWCSNYILWQKAKNMNFDNIIIFEDDVIVTDSNISNNIKKIVNNMPLDADIVYLDMIQYSGLQIPVQGNEIFNKFSANAGGWGAWSILYTKKGIEKLLNMSCYSHAIDNFIWSIVSNDRYIKPNCLPDNTELKVYISSFRQIEVPKNGSEICKMGRGYWQC